MLYTAGHRPIRARDEARTFTDRGTQVLSVQWVHYAPSHVSRYVGGAKEAEKCHVCKEGSKIGKYIRWVMLESLHGKEHSHSPSALRCPYGRRCLDLALPPICICFDVRTPLSLSPGHSADVMFYVRGSWTHRHSFTHSPGSLIHRGLHSYEACTLHTYINKSGKFLAR